MADQVEIRIKCWAFIFQHFTCRFWVVIFKVCEVMPNTKNKSNMKICSSS